MTLISPRSLLIAVCLSVFTLGGAAAELPFDQSPGLTRTKPDQGPVVEVEGGYMVPYQVTIPGTDVQFEMVPVPGGTFRFGSPDEDEEAKDDEKPPIEVVAAPMWVGRLEVRWAEYKEYMDLYATFKEFEARGIRPVTDENRVDALTAPTELYDPSFTFEWGEDPEQPAVTMTQFAAKQYTKWLSRLTGQQYRLPTEAEWEYACRGGTDTVYSWGDDPERIDEYAWYFDNAEEGQVQGGQKKPNPFGLYDMHGNVAEWTASAYTPEGYKEYEGKTVQAIDLITWPADGKPGVVRGGSWEMDPPDLRSAARLASDDEEWKNEDPNFPLSPWWFTSDPARGVGFRLFRSLEPLEEDLITKFWEAVDEEVELDVESRLSGGRGALGIVDPELPQATQDVRSNR